MTGPAPNLSAQPVKPARRRKPKPAARLNPHQSIRLIVRADGVFVPADEASRRLCRDRGMYSGIELIAYLYEPRDGKQWRQAHQVGTFLAEHVEKFHGMNAHDVIKAIQREGRIACDVRKLQAGNIEFDLVEPQSLAFGFIDESRWTEIYRDICGYIARAGWLGEIDDQDTVAAMERLMLRERAA